MRIIAGQWRGRRLVTPKHNRTRPTPDRVKEAVFSILGDVAEASILDAFSGTGALALEALSRGAHHADLVERDGKALEAIRANVDALGASASIHRGDVIRLLARGALKGPYDLVFIDPPYASGLWNTVLSGLDSAGVLSESARVINEHPTGTSIEAPRRFSVETERTYGDVSITILVPSRGA
ncbi:MAG: 16S rRNA (guanine(966)-N(2))-methyltransferase RsmD [Myxococcota bacterium]